MLVAVLFLGGAPRVRGLQRPRRRLDVRPVESMNVPSGSDPCSISSSSVSPSWSVSASSGSVPRAASTLSLSPSASLSAFVGSSPTSFSVWSDSPSASASLTPSRMFSANTPVPTTPAMPGRRPASLRTPARRHRPGRRRRCPWPAGRCATAPPRRSRTARRSRCPHCGCWCRPVFSNTSVSPSESVSWSSVSPLSIAYGSPIGAVWQPLVGRPAPGRARAAPPCTPPRC